MAPTPPPDLDHLHDSLLRAFLDPACGSIAAIAERFALTLTALLHWFQSERTRRELDAISDMARVRAQLLADLHLPAAVETLGHINAHLAALQSHLEDSEAEPEPLTTHLRLADTARKTVSAIQRLGSPRAARRDTPTASQPGPLAEPGDAPPRSPAANQPSPPPAARARDRPTSAAA